MLSYLIYFSAQLNGSILVVLDLQQSQKENGTALDVQRKERKNDKVIYCGFKIFKTCELIWAVQGDRITSIFYSAMGIFKEQVPETNISDWLSLTNQDFFLQLVTIFT